MFILNAGTALWILKNYDYLANEKEQNDLTTLQLLAKMPSTFKSQTPMGPFKSFLYICMSSASIYTPGFSFSNSKHAYVSKEIFYILVCFLCVYIHYY